MKNIIRLFAITLFSYLMLLTCGCTSYDVVLSTSGKVIQMDGDKALVQFPTQNGNSSGVAWFWMPGAVEGEKVKLNINQK